MTLNATNPQRIVVLTRRLPLVRESGFDFAPAVGPDLGVSVRDGLDRAMTRAEVLEHIRGAHVVVTWVSERVDAEFLASAGPQLIGVCNFAVGVDNIDLEACRGRAGGGVIVTNLPDAVTEGTADMAWALTLAVARRTVEADRFARSAEYSARGPLGPDEFLGQDLAGKTLHIVGAGRIGFAVAQRSVGWGMKVLYTARSAKPEFESAPFRGERVSLEEGLKRADVVSLHTPLTPETRHLIGRRELALLKPSAMLINTSRGPVVDEAALVDALRERRIWGAGLDVFENEPTVHPGLLSLTNCVLSPHIGSAGMRSRMTMTRMTLSTAAALLRGERSMTNRVV